MKLKSQAPNYLSMHTGVTPLGLIFWHARAGKRCLGKASYSLKAALLSQGAGVPLDWMAAGDGMEPPSSPPFLFPCTEGYVAAQCWPGAPQGKGSQLKRPAISHLPLYYQADAKQGSKY